MQTKKYRPTDFERLTKSSKRLPTALESKDKPRDFDTANSERHIIRSVN